MSDILARALDGHEIIPAGWCGAGEITAECSCGWEADDMSDGGHEHLARVIQSAEMGRLAAALRQIQMIAASPDKRGAWGRVADIAAIALGGHKEVTG